MTTVPSAIVDQLVSRIVRSVPDFTPVSEADFFHVMATDPDMIRDIVRASVLSHLAELGIAVEAPN